MENENFELFEAYISETLTVEEKQAFEERLNTDLRVKEAFELYTETYHFLEQEIRHKVRNESFVKIIKQADKTHFEELAKDTTKVIKMKPWMYIVAASVVLLFGILFTRKSVPTYDQFVSYESLELTVRSTMDVSVVKAEKAFNSKNFTEALFHLNTILEKHPSNNELLLYKAISLLELGRYEEADMIFKDLYQGYSVFKNKALWWAALGKLKQKDNEACKKLLKAVPKEAEDYKLAQKLLKKL